jgi:hypothetical protein
MKLLLDENLSRRIVPFIQDIYPESTQGRIQVISATIENSSS